MSPHRKLPGKVAPLCDNYMLSYAGKVAPLCDNYMLSYAGKVAPLCDNYMLSYAGKVAPLCDNYMLSYAGKVAPLCDNYMLSYARLHFAQQLFLGKYSAYISWTNKTYFLLGYKMCRCDSWDWFIYSPLEINIIHVGKLCNYQCYPL